MSKGINARILKNLTVREAIDEISSLEYLVGMRFHACLAGIKSGIKVLGINYDVKVRTLAQETGFPLLELDGQNIREGFESLSNLNPCEYKIPEFKFPAIL